MALHPLSKVKNKKQIRRRSIIKQIRFDFQ